MFEILPESAEVEQGSSAGGRDLTLVYSIPVNETQLGFQVLPESVQLQESRRCLRVLIIALGAPNEATAIPAYFPEVA